MNGNGRGLIPLGWFTTSIARGMWQTAWASLPLHPDTITFPASYCQQWAWQFGPMAHERKHAVRLLEKSFLSSERREVLIPSSCLWRKSYEDMMFKETLLTCNNAGEDTRTSEMLSITGKLIPSQGTEPRLPVWEIFTSLWWVSR